ncbi:hypothetical protein WMF04_46615 [Sorangium sp. So ce260]
MKITNRETLLLGSAMPPITLTLQEKDDVCDSIDPFDTLVNFASL